MLEINLVPDHLRKKKKSQIASSFSVPKETIIGLIGGLVVLLFIVHVIFQVIIFFRYAQHKGYQKQWEDVRPQKEQADVVINELRALQAKAKSLNGITTDRRILWSPKLNIVSDNLPREVWLTRIFFEDDVLLIQGSAVSKVANEMISVGNFVSNLKKQPDFQKALATIELGSIQRRTIKSVEVVDFVVTAKLVKSK